MSDMVNHPPHYTSGGIECIDAIRAALGDEAFVAYCRATAIKYLWRTGLKWDAEQDMRKAAWYVNKAADVLAEGVAGKGATTTVTAPTAADAAASARHFVRDARRYDA